MRPRREQVEVDVVSTYHCTSRCVRRALLLGREEDRLLWRKRWIESRLREIVQYFAVDVDTFNVMDNHLHLVLTIRPDIAAKWSNYGVARRWLAYHPPKTRLGDRPARDLEIANLARDTERIKVLRERLCSLSEFHKAIKEPLARQVNREEGVTGHFWEGRFHTRRILDEASRLAVMAYVDLNSVRACQARTPEESEFSGIYHRTRARAGAMAKMSRRDRTKALRDAASRGGSARDCVQFPVEPVPSILTPIRTTPKRRGVFLSIELDEYLHIVDRMGRLKHPGKTGRIPSELAPILDRLDVTSESMMSEIVATKTWRGSVIGLAASCQEEARRRGRKRLISAMAIEAVERRKTQSGAVT